jgi:uncharacterized iron-regulated protein
MPRQILPVILTLVFATSCSPSAFWRQDKVTPTLTAYRQSFIDVAGQELVERIPRNKLLTQIEAGRILWLGDHHRHSRLHALQTELLQQLQQRGVRMTFGLEAVGVRDEPIIRDFLANRVDLNGLCDGMRRRWDGSWLDDRNLDPWFYRSLLEFAKRHRIPVFALEPTPRLPLASRDSYMAQTLQKTSERYPNRLVVVIVGQTHLLGQGDLVRRVGLKSTVIGGQPTSALLSEAPQAEARGTCWRADSDLLWFGEMFPSR